MTLSLEKIAGFSLTVHRFRVKDKDRIEDPKPSLKMLITQNNNQLGSKFWISPDEADAFLVDTHAKCSPGTRMEP